MRKNYLHVNTTTILKTLSSSPDQLMQFTNLFNMDIPVTTTTITVINKLLSVYKLYYRNVLFLRQDTTSAEKESIKYFHKLFPNQTVESFDEMENIFSEICTSNGYCFQGGKTTGYYGPYIWLTNSTIDYSVDLLGTIHTVSVTFMDDFISRGWLRYYSSDLYGAAGWANTDGKLYAMNDAYPSRNDDTFNISYLKHETQHLIDYKEYPTLKSDSLEFRAKIIELIYYNDTEKLYKIIEESNNNPENSHSYASFMIVKLLEFYKLKLNNIDIQTLTIIKNKLKSIFDIHSKYLNNNTNDNELITFIEWYIKENNSVAL